MSASDLVADGRVNTPVSSSSGAGLL